MKLPKSIKGTAFCVKCGTRVETEGKIKRMQGGGKAFSGKCPSCGTNIFKFVK